MTSIKKIIKGVLFIFAVFNSLILMSCGTKDDAIDNAPPPDTTVNEVDFWLTKADQSVTLQKQSTVLAFGTKANIYPNIEVDDITTYQSVDGFGYTLTGGSVQVINQLSSTKRLALLNEMFSKNNDAIAVSYLRISIGASDLNETVFSYDDLPDGETDVNLTKFNLSQDATTLIPMLKDILAINPSIKIIATPWSAPVWMKDNKSTVGGSLLPQYYSAYANYFVKYIQTMKDNGITINAITPQNEPLHPGNNPSMYMTAADQATFIKSHLGPAFQAAGISTKIIVYDHNCDRPDYPLAILDDPAAAAYVDGSAFHLYAGDISTLSVLHTRYPNKNLYFTEQYTASTGDFSGDLNWHLKNVIIGSMRNWSKVAFEWNLANDAAFNPHTPGGCNTCKGAITVTGAESFTRNVAYYIIGHASKFVAPGSVRIYSSTVSGINNVCFKTPQGKYVLLVQNDSGVSQMFNIKQNGRWVTTGLSPGAVATYVW